MIKKPALNGHNLYVGMHSYRWTVAYVKVMSPREMILTPQIVKSVYGEFCESTPSQPQKPQIIAATVINMTQKMICFVSMKMKLHRTVQIISLDLRVLSECFEILDTVVGGKVEDKGCMHTHL